MFIYKSSPLKSQVFTRADLQILSLSSSSSRSLSRKQQIYTSFPTSTKSIKMFSNLSFTPFLSPSFPSLTHMADLNVFLSTHCRLTSLPLLPYLPCPCSSPLAFTHTIDSLSFPQSTRDVYKSFIFPLLPVLLSLSFTSPASQEHCIY